VVGEGFWGGIPFVVGTDTLEGIDIGGRLPVRIFWGDAVDLQARHRAPLATAASTARVVTTYQETD
jgi:hypothetical protein